MEASMIRAALDARGWKKIAISADTVLAVLDGVHVALRFDGEMMFDPVDEKHVLCTSLIGMVDGEERARVERWPLVDGEEDRLLTEAARAVEVAVRVGDGAKGDEDE
ncbi:MAG: hypothetical protein FJ096_02575 [Deltaproteobacteria bacterium]|nr:hypothetical protein [Deltaproteobacteria bacterium]